MSHIRSAHTHLAVFADWQLTTRRVEDLDFDTVAYTHCTSFVFFRRQRIRCHLVCGFCHGISFEDRRILVVEDDDGVRETAVSLLSELGYRVLKAVDATSALSVVESGIPIDLLFTDVVMPGALKSPELARKTRERLPGVAVLFTSGYTENSIVHGGRLDAGVNLLSKPYTREALARKVRHVLANQAQANSGAAPLPMADAPAADSDGKKANVVGISVMLVEDDVLIRMNTAELLKEMGHLVVEAGSAEEATTALQTMPVAVLVTDVNLPGISGPELARRALELRPDLGIVFATGDRHVDGIEAFDPARTTILSKPYDMRGLENAISGVFGGLAAQARLAPLDKADN